MSTWDFADLRKIAAFLTAVVMGLFIWMGMVSWQWLRRVGPAKSSRDVQRIRMMKDRVAVAISDVLFVGSVSAMHVWAAFFHSYGRPSWMIGHWFTGICIYISLVGVLLKIRIATQEAWGELPWIGILIMTILVSIAL